MPRASSGLPLPAGTSRRVPVRAALRRRLPNPGTVWPRTAAPERSGAARGGRSASHRAGDTGSAPRCGGYPERRPLPRCLLLLPPSTAPHRSAAVRGSANGLSHVCLSSATSAPLPALTPCSAQGRRRGLPCPAPGVGEDSQQLLEEALHHIGVEADNHLFVFLPLNLQLWLGAG